MRNRWLIPLGLLLAGLLLAACGGETAATVTSPTESTAAMPVATMSEPEEMMESTATSAPNAAPPEEAPVDTSTAVPPSEAPTETSAPPPAETAAEVTALIGTTPGRPALIEFWASW